MTTAAWGAALAPVACRSDLHLTGGDGPRRSLVGKSRIPSAAFACRLECFR
jgi:hypothetical protein